MNEICQAHVPGGMTTAQLIAELQKHPGDTPVFCCDEIGGSVRVSEFYFDAEPARLRSDVPCIKLR